MESEKKLAFFLFDRTLNRFGMVDLIRFPLFLLSDNFFFTFSKIAHSMLTQVASKSNQIQFVIVLSISMIHNLCTVYIQRTTGILIQLDFECVFETQVFSLCVQIEAMPN